MSNLEWQKYFNSYQSFTKKVGDYNILKYIKKFANKEDIILDFGSGKGEDAIKIFNEKYSNIEAYDVTDIFFEYNKKIKFILSEDGNLNVLTNNYYDIIYASGVLHHLYKPIETLDKLRDKLKDNGKLIFIEPRHSIFRSFSEFLLFYTPLSFIFNNLVSCLKEEWPTYKPWTKNYSNNMFFLLKKINFEIILVKKTIFNIEVVCKKK